MNLSKKYKYKRFHQTKSFLVSFLDFIKGKNKNRRFGARQENIDKKLVYSLSPTKIPNKSQLKHIKKVLTSRELFIVKILFLVIIVSIVFLGIRTYKLHLHVVPGIGGEYVEGLLGFPKYINPLYSSTRDADSDITKLVYSGLLKLDNEGELINDIAESYTISDNEKQYTFTIREDVKWHNGDKLVIDDVIFTFNAIQDLRYNSPLRHSFLGVDIERVDDKTLQFNLTEPYAAFLELLTFGILPQDIWININPETASLAELNIEPIGSGPYKIKSLIKNKKGEIKEYSLTINDDFYGNKPKIEKITFKFFVNTTESIAALNEGLIDGISYLPSQYAEEVIARDSLNFYNINLPQITAVFFNENKNPYLEDVKFRQALLLVVNKPQIILEVFNNNADLINGPISPSSFAFDKEANKYELDREKASELLTELGWEFFTIKDGVSSTELTEETIEALGEGKFRIKRAKKASEEHEFLTITLTTVDAVNNVKVVEMIKSFWDEIGVRTDINIVSPKDIQTNVIKPRNFEALFYGQVVGIDPDSYAFWHSSQIGENGLNIANYSNKIVDKLLEDARLTSNLEERKEKYKEFQEILAKDIPAIFVYSPVYTYVQSKRVKGFNVKIVSSPSDRFNNISDWYIKTKKKLVW